MLDLGEIHRNIQKRYPGIYINQAKVGHIDWDAGISEIPTKLQSCIKGIVYNLENGSDHAFYWISKLCDLETEDGTSKYRYLRLVWAILHGFIDRHREIEFVREIISALEFFFKKMGHREKPIYLYHAILLLVRRNEIDWSSRPPSIDTPVKDIDKLYRRHLVGGKMPMDSYILDLHTHGGKRSVDCLQNFALEGAYIKHENVNFLRQDYRDIYIKLKQELDLYRSRGGRLQ